MKNLLIVFAFFATVQLVAQTPSAFSYQAVARTDASSVLASQSIGIKASIVASSASGIAVYSELHNPTTNELGLFAIGIGNGTVESGDFSTIDWGGDIHFLKIEADFDGGTNYQLIGSSQILSVPYAIHASTVDNADDADADPANEIQTLSIEGNQLMISNGNAVNLPVSDTSGMVDADADPNNEIQDLSSTIVDDQVTVAISGGGNSTSFSVNDADADETNELQNLSISGTTLSISEGNSVEIPTGGSDADADPMNEIQTISKSGSTVSLNLGGGSFEDEKDDADADPTNEIQSLSISGSTVSISGGNSIEIPSGGMDGDTDPMNEIQSLSLVALSDAGIDGMTQYELNLTDSDPVILPYNEYWQAQVFLSEPPSIANINTSYPVNVENVFTATTVKAAAVESSDVLVGIETGAATHIQPEGIHFDPVVNDVELGFFLEREEIAYRATLPSNDFLAKLNKQSLTFANLGGWTSTYLGGDMSGELSLYPGGGLPQFFRAFLDGNDPKFELRNSTGLLVRGTQTTQGPGDLGVMSPATGNYNVRMSHANNFTNNGWLGVYNDDTPKIFLFVDGTGTGRVMADLKNFHMQHPEEADKEIIYASLEGPEAGAYERGTATLSNGEATIQFSDHFNHVIGSMNMTVMITPLSADSKGIAVIEKSEDGFKVKELFQGNGNYAFDWEVKAVRAGYEDYQVVMDKADFNAGVSKPTTKN